MNEIFEVLLGPAENWKSLPLLFLITANSSYPPRESSFPGSSTLKLFSLHIPCWTCLLPVYAALCCINPTHPTGLPQRQSSFLFPGGVQPFLISCPFFHSCHKWEARERDHPTGHPMHQDHVVPTLTPADIL